MKKPVKWALKAAVLLLLAFILLLLGIRGFFGPDDLKHLMVGFVQEKTGHRLEINGAAKLHWFPSVALQLSQVRLMTNRDSGGQPLFSAAELGLKMDLWPLLGRHVKIDELALKQPVVNLLIDREGQRNWESLLLDLPEKEPISDAARAQDSGFSFAIHRVLLQDASLHWRDEQSAKRIDLQHLGVSVGYLLPGRPAPIEAQLKLTAADPALNLDLSLKGELAADESFSDWGIKGLVMEMTALREAAGERGIKLKLLADLGMNFPDKSFQLNDFTIIGADTHITGQLHGKGFHDLPLLKGGLVIRELNLRSWLLMLGVEVDTSDSSVLARMNGEIGLQQQGKLLVLDPMRIQLDDSRIHGKAQIMIEDNLQISGQLTIDDMDLDRYLANGDASEGTVFQLSARVEALRNLQLDAEIVIDRLTLNKIDLQQATIKVRSREGTLLLAH